MNTTQDDILLLALKGDKDRIKAFKKLFYKYYDMLFKRAYQIVKDEHACEDIVLELFEEFYNEQYFNVIKTNVAAFLLTRCRQRAINYLIANRRYKERLEKYSRKIDRQETPTFTFQLWDKLANEVNIMPSRQREAFRLASLQGCQYSQAAEIMGISINSFKVHYKLAIKRLRKSFGTSNLADLL